MDQLDDISPDTPDVPYDLPPAYLGPDDYASVDYGHDQVSDDFLNPVPPTFVVEEGLTGLDADEARGLLHRMAEALGAPESVLDAIDGSDPGLHEMLYQELTTDDAMGRSTAFGMTLDISMQDAYFGEGETLDADEIAALREAEPADLDVGPPMPPGIPNDLDGNVGNPVPPLAGALDGNVGNPPPPPGIPNDLDGNVGNPVPPLAGDLDGNVANPPPLVTSEAAGGVGAEVQAGPLDTTPVPLAAAAADPATASEPVAPVADAVPPAPPAMPNGFVPESVPTAGAVAADVAADSGGLASPTLPPAGFPESPLLSAPDFESEGPSDINGELAEASDSSEATGRILAAAAAAAAAAGAVGGAAASAVAAGVKAVRRRPSGEEK